MDKRSQVSPLTDTAVSHAELVQATIHFIRNHYAEPVRVSQIAHSVGLSPKYLSTIFHSNTGNTLIGFLTRERLHQACSLLQRGLSIKVVARQVGYPDQRYFSRVFQRYFGVSPGEYRISSKRANGTKS